jgi:hypothetical protein
MHVGDCRRLKNFAIRDAATGAKLGSISINQRQGPHFPHQPLAACLRLLSWSRRSDVSPHAGLQADAPPSLLGSSWFVPQLPLAL